ncbi:helix-turn-helix domain-containing protein [Parabacteroides sp.]
MSKNQIHEKFVKAIRERIPHKATLTNTLVDLLCIEREAVYRRMRGEVAFTFEEIATISNKLGISLDNLVGSYSVKSRPYQLCLVEYIDPIEDDYKMWETYNERLKEAREDPASSSVECMNVLPTIFLLDYNFISRFYLFKWYNQYGYSEKTAHFRQIEPAEKFREVQRITAIESKHVKNTTYVWDPLIFQYIVNDIRYYSSVHLIDAEEVGLLKRDLLRFVDEIEDLAARGTYKETGNPIQFYISNINFDASYSYLETKNLHISIIRAFILNTVISFDEKAYEIFHNWLQALLKSSTMISVSGEKQRIMFFEKQRAIIGSL